MNVSFFFLITFPLYSYASHADYCSSNLKIYANDNWPPYSYKDNGQLKGIEIGILEKVLTDANLCWKYVSYPSSSRAIKELKKGTVDMLFSASVTESRKKYFQFTEPYRLEKMTLFGRKSELDKASNEYDFQVVANDPHFRKSILAINRGSFYGDAFTSFKEKCYQCTIELNLVEERFEMLHKNRVDYFIEDYLSGLYLLKENKKYQDTVTSLPITVHSNSVRYMLREGVLSTSELNKLNESIKNNKRFILNEIDIMTKYLLK